jgi:hypothetical protein
MTALLLHLLDLDDDSLSQPFNLAEDCLLVEDHLGFASIVLRDGLDREPEADLEGARRFRRRVPDPADDRRAVNSRKSEP